jgi:hypothetical protein
MEGSERDPGAGGAPFAARRTPVRGVALFFGAYVSLAAAAALALGNREFVLYVAVLIVLAAVVGLVHLRVNFTRGALQALAVWGLVHMAGGLVPVPEGWAIEGSQRVLYSLWIVPGHLKYDHVVHAYGFGVATWVCWQGMRASFARAGAPVDPTFGRVVLAATAGLGFGALNEVVEFLAVLLVPETNVGGYWNTGWDLVSNLVGAAVAAGLLLLSARRRAAEPQVPKSRGTTSEIHGK